MSARSVGVVRRSPVDIERVGVDRLADLLATHGLFDSPPLAEALREYLADERNVFLLASEGDRAVGFLRGSTLRQLRTVRRQMFIYEIGVAGAHRRQGIGRALIEALLHYCRSNDFEEAFVLTDAGNEAAVNLYRSTGAVTENPADRMFVYHFS